VRSRPSTKDFPPLLEVFVTGHRELPDDHDPMPFCSLLALALLVAVSLVGRDQEIHDRQTGGRVTDFRVLPEVADNHYLIQ